MNANRPYSAHRLQSLLRVYQDPPKARRINLIAALEELVERKERNTPYAKHVRELQQRGAKLLCHPDGQATHYVEHNTDKTPRLMPITDAPHNPMTIEDATSVVKHGLRRLRASNMLESEASYNENYELHGVCRTKYPSGATHKLIPYENGKRHGREQLFSLRGQCVQVTHWDDGVRQCDMYPDPSKPPADDRSEM